MAIKIWFLLAFFCITFAWGQDSPSDSTLLLDKSKKETRPSTDPPKNFQFILQRGFMLGASTLDTVPLSGFSSGTWSAQLAFRINFARNVLALRIAPAYSRTRLSYNQTNFKTFPTVTDTSAQRLEFERHNLAFIDLPISLCVNLKRDEDNDPIVFVEAGGFVGYLIRANYQQRFSDGNGLRVFSETSRLQRLDSEFLRLRYGIFARIGYKGIAVHASYRLTDVFDEFTNEALLPKDVSGFRNPSIPPIEFGLSLLLF